MKITIELPENYINFYKNQTEGEIKRNEIVSHVEAILEKFAESWEDLDESE